MQVHNMLSGGYQTDGNALEIFLTPYQYSRLPLSHWFPGCLLASKLLAFLVTFIE